MGNRGHFESNKPQKVAVVKSFILHFSVNQSVFIKYRVKL